MRQVAVQARQAQDLRDLHHLNPGLGARCLEAGQEAAAEAGDLERAHALQGQRYGAGGLRQGHPGANARAGLRLGRQAEGVVATLARTRAADVGENSMLWRVVLWHGTTDLPEGTIFDDALEHASLEEL